MRGFSKLWMFGLLKLCVVMFVYLGVDDVWNVGTLGSLMFVVVVFL